MQELKDVLWLQQVAQPVLAQVPQLDVLRQGIPGQVMHRLGEEDLLTISGGEEAHQAIDRSSNVITMSIRGGLTGMQGHPHP